VITAKTVTSTVVLCSGILLIGAMVGHVSAWDRDDDGEKDRIEQGFAIAPVHLTFEHKNRDLVGLGSYIVNAQAACNDCHSPGGISSKQQSIFRTAAYKDQSRRLLEWWE
jgi:hypothetical protein